MREEPTAWFELEAKYRVPSLLLMMAFEPKIVSARIANTIAELTRGRRTRLSQ